VDPSVPDVFEARLLWAVPNPFSPETTIRFALPEKAPVRLGVYEVTGRLVRSFETPRLSAGVHEIRWDGRDAHGAPVASGIYFARLEAGVFTETIRLSLIR
jgi:flagellar hook assembly protein FlgD